MPSFNLGASGAATDAVPVGNGISVGVSGTFAGTVQFQRAPAPGGTFAPLAADVTGASLQFTAPSGTLLIIPSPNESDAVIRAVATAYTSGTAVVQIGK